MSIHVKSMRLHRVTRMFQISLTPAPSGPKSATSKRVNGKIVNVIRDETTGEEKTSVSERVNGEIVTVMQPSGSVQ